MLAAFARTKAQRSRILRSNMTAWLLLAPTLVFLLAFTVFPILRSLYLSFHQLELGMREPFYIGIRNFAKLFKSALFGKVMRNTGIYSLLTVIPTMAMGLLLAMVLNQRFRGIGFLRTAYFYPVVMPMIACASIWMFIYMPQTGMLSQLLLSMGIGEQYFLSRAETVLPSLALVYVWKEAGYMMIFFLSGLQNISPELYEAARIDGANAWTTFRRITFPLLMPTTLFVSTIALTNSIKMIDQVVIMTEGAPSNGSSMLLYYIYQNGFIFFDQGLASTLTVIMLLIMLAITMVQFLGTDNRIHYSN